MNRAVKMGLMMVAVTGILGAESFAARRRSVDVLVVPSRYTIIQLAFDIVALRGAALIAYDGSGQESETVLHFWDGNTRAWKRLSAEEYAMGAFVASELDEMFLIGGDSDLPVDVIAGASQAGKVTRIDTLNLMTVVNTLNTSMKFSRREWQTLAERHGLQIKDLNAERRRWGRYGPPNKKAEVRPSSDSDMLEPEDVIELGAPIIALEAGFKDETPIAVEAPASLPEAADFPMDEKGMPAEVMNAATDTETHAVEPDEMEPADK